jgi:hypothetical protein
MKEICLGRLSRVEANGWLVMVEAAGSGIPDGKLHKQLELIQLRLAITIKTIHYVFRFSVNNWKIQEHVASPYPLIFSCFLCIQSQLNQFQLFV